MDGVLEFEDPESLAAGFRLALAHLVQTSKQLQIAVMIQQAEESIDCQLVHGAAKA